MPRAQRSIVLESERLPPLASLLVMIASPKAANTSRVEPNTNWSTRVRYDTRGRRYPRLNRNAISVNTEAVATAICGPSSVGSIQNTLPAMKTINVKGTSIFHM